MDDNYINDVRTNKEFKSMTFSNFKKSDVCKELLSCINKNKLESALNWSVELICSGYLKDLWETIILVISKHIHLGNPKLPIYIDKRFDNFKAIVDNGYVDNELALRNSDQMRTLFAELITVLCDSDKKPSFEIIKNSRRRIFLIKNLW